MPEATDQFDAFMQQAFIDLMMEVPEFPTHMGILEVNGIRCPQDRFSGVGTSSNTARLSLLSKLTNELHALDTSQLDNSRRISRDVFSFFLSYAQERDWIGTEGSSFLSHKYIFCPSVGLQSEMPLFLRDLHPSRTGQDMEDYVSRVRQIPELIDSAGDFLDTQSKLGIQLPEFVMTELLAEMDTFLTPDIKHNIIYTTFEGHCSSVEDLSDRNQESLVREIGQLLTKKLYPAYQRASTRIKKQSANDDAGVWKLPDGEAYYQFLLRCATTTELGAAEIHELGLAETASVQKKIQQAFKQLDYPEMPIGLAYKRLVSELHAPLNDDASTRQQLVNQAQGILTEAKAMLPSWFSKLPGAEAVIETIPEFAEQSRNQIYNPPLLDGSRAGKLELNLLHLIMADTPNLRTLIHHEVWPGHHLQMSLALENTSLPLFNRIITFDAYIEGWAKYAETLPMDYGKSVSIHQSLLTLRAELISSVNLALDTGIHHKRWTEAYAIDWFKTQTGMPEDFARYIVHRSCTVPAQMCAYKLGLMKMRDLKTTMQAKEGNNFELARFHNMILKNGALPLSVLEREFSRALN